MMRRVYVAVVFALIVVLAFAGATLADGGRWGAAALVWLLALAIACFAPEGDA